jgi:hypothetical protein
MGGEFCQVVNYDRHVPESLADLAVAAQANEVWNPFQGIAEGSKESPRCQENPCSMLEMPCNGTEAFESYSFLFEDLLHPLEHVVGFVGG